MKDIRKKFYDISNYIVYYGQKKEDELSKYDMAVLEPMGHSDGDIVGLNEKGTMAIAYLSAMEIHPSHPDFNLIKEGRLEDGGSLIMNDDYGTYIMDMGSEAWNRLLIHKASKLCCKHNYDGIFLDTLGDVDTTHLPMRLRQMQLIHAVNFVKSLRQALPDRVIIQNNGIENLSIHTSDYIDGICWEGPGLNDKSRAVYNKGILGRLRYLRDEKNLRIMMLCDNAERSEEVEFTRKFADEKNFLFYNASLGYTGI